MKTIPLLLPSNVEPSDGDLVPFHEAVRSRTGLRLAPVRVPNAALLPQLLEDARTAVAWAPSRVAFSLGRLQLAAPLVSVRPQGLPSRSAVLVARRGIEGLADLAGRRIGWVSRLSATGYQVPRLYLESFGIELRDLFAEQRFYGSHRHVVAALASGEVDVVATHTRRLRDVATAMPARILASVGPIPADVLVAGSELPPPAREALRRALLAVGVPGCEIAFVPEGHLSLFDALWSAPRTTPAAPAALTRVAWPSP